jgi:hypothetical protein
MLSLRPHDKTFFLIFEDHISRLSLHIFFIFMRYDQVDLDHQSHGGEDTVTAHTLNSLGRLAMTEARGKKQHSDGPISAKV